MRAHFLECAHVFRPTSEHVSVHIYTCMLMHMFCVYACLHAFEHVHLSAGVLEHVVMHSSDFRPHKQLGTFQVLGCACTSGSMFECICINVCTLQKSKVTSIVVISPVNKSSTDCTFEDSNRIGIQLYNKASISQTHSCIEK